jgi:hypothetical protein
VQQPVDIENAEGENEGVDAQKTMIEVEAARTVSKGVIASAVLSTP